MKRRYRYSYQTIVRYEQLVKHHSFMVRCTPYVSAGQMVREESVDLLSSAVVKRAKDHFGANIIYGEMREPHDIFVVASNGVVDCESYRVDDPRPHPVYLASTHMTSADDAIKLFAKGITAEGSALDRAVEIAGKVHEYMNYTPYSTSVETTAAMALSQKMGVCQDFAHLMIAISREVGIFARYVVGFVVGTGETHAWVEVYSDGAWYGVDPTHNRVLDFGYIKIAHGRDALDCSVVRGVHRGSSCHTTEVRVVLEELEYRG